MENQAKAIDFIADPQHIFVMFKPIIGNRINSRL